MKCAEEDKSVQVIPERERMPQPLEFVRWVGRLLTYYDEASRVGLSMDPEKVDDWKMCESAVRGAIHDILSNPHVWEESFMDKMYMPGDELI